MEAENGTYLISAHASPARGGATGANTLAYRDAQKFCAARALHAVVIAANERDVYQTSVAGQSGGAFGGDTSAAGNVNLRFRCAEGSQADKPPGDGPALRNE
jgi:hypothetical protein